MRLRQRIVDAPIVVTAMLMGIAFGALFLVNPLAGLGGITWSSVTGAAVAGLLFGVAMGFVINAQRKRSGGVSRARAVTNALKSGQLPPEATVDEWAPLLGRRMHQARLFRRAGPLEFGLFALLGVYLFFTVPAGRALWSVEIVFFLVLVVWYPIWAAREVPKIRALERQLANRHETRD